MNNVEQPLLLVIDDETAILTTLKEALEDEQFRVETLIDASKALDKIGELLPDIVILDIFMPPHNGIKILENIKREYPTQKVIMISGYGTISIAIEAVQKGAFDFIEKPLNLDEILNKISFLKNQGLTNSHPPVEYDVSMHGLVGQSALFGELIRHANLVAPLRVPLLIYGGPGSGKTLFARYIHHKNNFDPSSFMTLTCTALQALPHNLSSHRGSVFLKHIHELDSRLQNDVYEYLKEEHPHQKFIASSSVNLFDKVKNKTFNRSLFCMLHASSLEIPPLIKRRCDIPLLANHFMHETNHKYGVSVSLSAKALRFLRNFEWTGDVAHLKACIDVVVGAVGSTQSILDVSDFYDFMPSQPAEHIEQQMYTRFHSLDDATTSFQQRYLHHLLKIHRYDVAQLAEFLQMPLTKLHTKMSELNINQ
jgi:two-component system nitrogen regulation response regulator NtrX